eukprot:6004978-Pyramimonas_sp.AAC.1
MDEQPRALELGRPKPTWALEEQVKHILAVAVANRARLHRKIEAPKNPKLGGLGSLGARGPD